MTQLFCEKYKNVYTSVPINEDDLNQIDSVIIDRLNCIYSLDCVITPMIIKSCISKLKADKTDGDICLLIRLKESGYGCHMNGHFMGVRSYADDITYIFHVL